MYGGSVACLLVCSACCEQNTQNLTKHKAEKTARVRQRYPERDLAPVDFSVTGKPWGLADYSTRIQLRDSNSVGTYLTVEVDLPRLDWSLMVLTETRSVLWTRAGFLVSGLALFLAGFLTWLYLRERYRRERELALRGEQFMYVYSGRR